jgi:hypothetical protein
VCREDARFVESYRVSGVFCVNQRLLSSANGSPALDTDREICQMRRLRSRGQSNVELRQPAHSLKHRKHRRADTY